MKTLNYIINSICEVITKPATPFQNIKMLNSNIIVSLIFAALIILTIAVVIILMMTKKNKKSKDKE